MEESKFKGKPKMNQRIKEKLFDKEKKELRQNQIEKGEVERLKGVLERGEIPEPSKLHKFSDLPLSKKTILGLKESGFVKMTDIQRESVGLALRGMDILGAAQTGSGKTLAFVVPVIEKLFLNLWTHMDGLGALIITPTRELAYQIFETLRNVGRRHDFSAGLIIGGKDLAFERKRMDQINIIICTPGRLLQHMDENPSFDCSNVQMLVLDEADRCLDMGFEQQMNAIIDNLPIERQTLLFSATQTKSVKDLARLSLKSPVYVSVHENSSTSTPSLLQQSFVVCPLEDKLDFLWSFLRHHRKHKILVFLSSCKQVRFIHLLFCRMRPGLSVLCLHGGMHQMKRMGVYDDFSKKTRSAVLFATDIAARGLDFPGIDWVVQLDCPEDTTTYIHRAGRTARYNKGGESLLVLLPSEEEKMVANMKERKIPIQHLPVDPKKLVSVKRKFEALLARDKELKECGQRAFKAYLKSVFLMKDKQVFNIKSLDLDAFANSLGLAVAPRVRFLQKKGLVSQGSKDDENLTKKLEKEGDDSDSDIEVNEDLGQEVDEGKRSRVSISNGKDKNQKKTTFNFNLPEDEEGGDEEEGNLDTLFKSRKPADLSISSDEAEEFKNLINPPQTTDNKSKKPKSKAALAKKLLKKNIQANKKIVFDEEGAAVPDKRRDKQSEKARDYENEDEGGIDIEKAKEIMKEEDQYDRQIFREKIRARHREERLKKRAERKARSNNNDKDEAVVELGRGVKAYDSGSDDSEDEGPNLDWLPDPDKFYGPKKDDEENESDDDNEDKNDDDSNHYVSDDEDEQQADIPRGKRSLEDFDSEDSENEDDNEIPPPIVSKSKNKKQKLIQKAKSSLLKDRDVMEDLALKLLSK